MGKAVASLQAGSAAVAHSHSSVGTKAATAMALELWAALLSDKEVAYFFPLDATKAANQIVSFPHSTARFISSNMMLQLKAPAVMKTLGCFGFYIFTVFCGIRIDLIVFGGMHSSSWRHTNIKYDMLLGYIDKQVAMLLSGEIIFLSSVCFRIKR